MPIIFVHGVNNRVEDVDYAANQRRTEGFLRDFFAPRIGLDSALVDIRFPYWGGDGVKFRWNQASLPSRADQVESLNLGTQEAASNRAELWLGEARFQYGSGGISFAGLSRKAGFETAVDLIWDTASSLCRSEKECAQIRAQYAASLAYAKAHQVPTWAFQQPPLSNAQFVDKLMEEIAPLLGAESATARDETFGLAEGYSLLHEVASRLAGAPADGATSVVLALARKALHDKASRFLGDVFCYLDKRGHAGAPGKILAQVLGEIRTAAAARRPGDDQLVVIGHSLGGVIVYDLLTHFDPSLKIDLFVSVGSQVALFEEMTLYRISQQGVPPQPPKDRLHRPSQIARWLNVYDTNDIFSFLASGVFADVEDYRFDTGYGLLEAHGGYFARPSFYKRLGSRVGQV